MQKHLLAEVPPDVGRHICLFAKQSQRTTLAPGMTDNPAEVDSLAEQVARYLARGTPASDNYAEPYMIAGIIRPALRSSIDAGETFPLFLLVTLGGRSGVPLKIITDAIAQSGLP